ncbi:MAG: hypothetical protein V3T05_00885 [Myxococcota bacterium]
MIKLRLVLVFVALGCTAACKQSTAPKAAPADKPAPEPAAKSVAAPAAGLVAEAKTEPVAKAPLRRDIPRVSTAIRASASTGAIQDKPETVALDPLLELAELGEAAAAETDAAPQGGGSIRAKRETDLLAVSRRSDPNNSRARVESVHRGRFPLVALKIQIVRAAREGDGARHKKGDRIVVLPKLAVESGRVDMYDLETEINGGAYYLKRGDKIAVRVGHKRSRAWSADYIERE